MTWLDPAGVRACSCVQPRLARAVIPADGARGFPTDGTIRVFLTGGFPEPLRAGLSAEYRLRDAGGALVPMDSRVVGTRLDLRPRAPLRPASRYVLEGVFAYDGSGVRVSDTDRWVAAIRATQLHGAWFPVASFETAPGPEGRRVLAARITAARLHYARGGGDCGPGIALSVDLDLPPTVLPTDVIELRVDGTGTVGSAPARGATRAGASDLLCNPDPVSLPVTATTKAQVVVLSAAGTEIGASGWTRATGSPPSWVSPSWGGHRRSSTPLPALAERIARWLSLPVGDAAARLDAVPAACPHGLEIASVRAAAAGGPWMFEELSTLVSGGNAGWLAVAAGESSTNVLGIATDGSPRQVRSGIAGGPVVGTPGAGGPYFATRVYRETGSPETTLHALRSDGSTRWSRRLEAEGSDLRLAAGGARVLASWLLGQLDGRVVWAVFDEASGAPVGRARPSAHVVHVNRGLASASAADRFLVAWQNGAGEITVATLSRDGVERGTHGLGVSGDGPLDLVSAGSHAALVAASDGQIVWFLLDPNGAVLRGPVVVSAGVGGRDNRKPRLAWNGELFAVAWETHPAERTYVTVVDDAGHVGPALALAPDRPSSTAGVAALGRGFVGSHTLDPLEERRSVVAAVLRCRAAAPRGAPQRIRPAP